MNDVSWIDHPALKNLDPRKLAVLVEIMNESDGKPLEKSLPILVSANMKLKSQNLSFTPEETTVIFEILTRNMAPAEKQRLNNLRNLMDKKVKGFK